MNIKTWVLAGLLVVVRTVSADLPLVNNLTLLNAEEQIALIYKDAQSVIASYEELVLVAAVGQPSGGQAYEAKDVDSWQFINITRRASQASAKPYVIAIGHKQGIFGRPKLVQDVWVGDIYDPLPRTMALGEAIQKIRDAGYAQPFRYVSMRKPLIHPMPKEAYYIFAMIMDPADPNSFIKYVFVGMESGEVFEDSILTQSLPEPLQHDLLL